MSVDPPVELVHDLLVMGPDFPVVVVYGPLVLSIYLVNLSFHLCFGLPLGGLQITFKLVGIERCHWGSSFEGITVLLIRAQSAIHLRQKGSGQGHPYSSNGVHRGRWTPFLEHF
jgi:hypothetical protein